MKSKEKYPLNCICAFENPKPDNHSIFELKFYVAEENFSLTFEAASVEEAERFAEALRTKIFAIHDGTPFHYPFSLLLNNMDLRNRHLILMILICFLPISFTFQSIYACLNLRAKS